MIAHNHPLSERLGHWVADHRKSLEIGVVLLLLALGMFALHKLLGEVSFHQVRAAVRALDGSQIALALGFTTASYFLLTLYDVLALRIIGRPLPWRTAALASFTSYTLSHNLGLSLLTGGSARYRIYTANGLSPGDVARVVATASITFWSGVTVMAATALAIHPEPIQLGSLQVPLDLQRLVGILVLVAAATVIALCRKPGRTIRIRNWHLPLPTAGQAVGQVAIAGLDLAAASAALFVLVPQAGPGAFPAFFLAYALAMIVALLTHVPGGVGVFEAVMLAALPGVDQPTLLAALVAYRAIYYLLPLMVAAVCLIVHERARWREPLSRMGTATRSFAAGVTPQLLAALCFLGGTVLLISGSLPPIHHRLHELRHLIPLPFVEASHIAASLAGTGLLLLAPGLYRRLDSASVLARLLLIAGAVFSLTKGADYEEAVVLTLIAGLLHWSRHSFYRRTALTMQSLSPRWLLAVATALTLSIWIGLFAFKHVGYQSDLWWQFAWKGDAPRFLRASFASAVIVLAAIVIRFGRPAIVHDESEGLPGPEDAEAFSHCDRTDAMLAWTGDKRFLHSQDGGAFLMYQVQGRSWIVMGDPVGPRSEWADLLWRLRELADAAQGRVLLYQATADLLPFAIDLGLQLVKYGEEARIDLATFTLEGPAAKGLRYAERRATREGAEFAVVPAAQVGAIMAELRSISDEWLKLKGHGEKAFSVGFFDEAYLQRFDCAIVRHEGRIVAFANIWATENRNELSIDLMRHAAEMPYGVMDFLFVRLMEWGRDQGYRWFTLGLAPLSGLSSRPLAPFWARAGEFLYRHGDSFYGFGGLRAYKEKFSPHWEPRYIAASPGISLPRALLDLQRLVGGGRGSAASQTLQRRGAPQAIPINQEMPA